MRQEERIDTRRAPLRPRFPLVRFTDTQVSYRLNWGKWGCVDLK